MKSIYLSGILLSGLFALTSHSAIATETRKQSESHITQQREQLLQLLQERILDQGIQTYDISASSADLAFARLVQIFAHEGIDSHLALPQLIDYFDDNNFYPFEILRVIDLGNAVSLSPASFTEFVDLIPTLTYGSYNPLWRNFTQHYDDRSQNQNQLFGLLDWLESAVPNGFSPTDITTFFDVVNEYSIPPIIVTMFIDIVNHL